METSDSIVNDESFLDRLYYLLFGIRNLFLKIIFLPQLSIVYETIKQSHQFTK